MDDTLCMQTVLYSLDGGQPPGGMYSGDGVTGNQFNLESAGMGMHTLYYTYTDGNGCTGSASAQSVVELCDNLFSAQYQALLIYQDSNFEHLVISGDVESCTIFDLTGQMVSASDYPGNHQIRISTDGWSSGVYFIVIGLKNGRLISEKIVISKFDR